MGRSSAAVLACALLTRATTCLNVHTATLLSTDTSDPIVGGVHVSPPDYEDYRRGRTSQALFAKGAAPGQRKSLPGKGTKVPRFDATNPASTPEVFQESTGGDPVGMLCSPGGNSYGHYFYNVVDPEIVPFIVPQDQPGRKDMMVVVAPGGGHIHLAWEPSGVGVAEWLNSQGISAAVLKYRVPDTTSQVQVMDAQRAMSLVRHQAASYGVSPTRIGYFGASASGALGLKLATAKQRGYARIDEIDDVSFKPDFMMLLFPSKADGILTPETAATMPPVFLAHASDDVCTSKGAMEKLAASLNQYSSKPFHYNEYKNGRHGWATCEYYPKLIGQEMCGYKSSAMDFLQKDVLGEQ